MFTRSLSAILALVLLLSLTACVGQQGGQRGRNITVTPTGEYATIDMTASEKLMKSLQSTSQSVRDQAVQEVLDTPQSVIPPVLCQLSAVLFERGEKDEAAFWFQAGRLRARYDANRCADISAREAVGVLNQRYGPNVNKYLFQDDERLKRTVYRAVEWEEKTPHDYDHRWINLHGLHAIQSGLDPNGKSAKAPLSLPEDQWPRIAQETRDNYLKGLDQALETIAKIRAQQPAAN